MFVTFLFQGILISVSCMIGYFLQTAFIAHSGKTQCIQRMYSFFYQNERVTELQEFWCILHGFLYFLAIPSMSMLLMLYSIGNLHVVSWGTRETPKPAQGSVRSTTLLKHTFVGRKTHFVWNYLQYVCFISNH